MKKKPRLEAGFVLFDVVYHDGSRTSYRKVPAAQFGAFDDIRAADDIKAAKAFIEQQDRNIAERSGVQRGPIKAVLRSTKQ
jgi:hypothetical protein